MKNIVIATLFLSLLLTQVSFTQSIEERPIKGFKYNNNFDLAFGIGEDGFSTAFSWSKFHPLGKKQKLKLGYGLRLTNYFGSDKIYTTAPASLIKENLIDELTFSTAQTNSLNSTINIQYRLSPKFEVGFNIDAIGLGFGQAQQASREGIHVSRASPTSVNVLLIGNNDIGSLNSEFYLRYWFHPKFGIRAGLSHLFSEYTTKTKLAYNNDRYRLVTDLAIIGFTYTPF